MPITLFGIDQTGNNNRVKVDSSTPVDVSMSAFPHVVETVSKFEAALWDGRAYSAGTGVQDVDPDTYLNQRFVNPVDSGKVCYVDFRVVLSNLRDGKVPLDGGFIFNPVGIDDATDVTPSNLYTGHANTSAMSFEWWTSATRLDRDPPQAGDPTGFFVPTGGSQYRIETPRIVPPGFAVGIFIHGREALSESEKASISYVWYEEDV